MKLAPRSPRSVLAALPLALVGLLATDLFSLGGFAQGQTQRPQGGQQRSGAAQAQPTPPQPAPQPAQQAQPAQQPTQQMAEAGVSGWVTRCIAQGRRGNAECVAEQNVTLTRTGQVALIVAVRVPAEGQAPTLAIRLPHGLALAAGAKLRLDQNFSLDLPIQTCDASGCFVTAPNATDLVNRMRAAKQLLVVVRNASTNQDMTLGMTLDGFPAAHDRVK